MRTLRYARAIIMSLALISVAAVNLANSERMPEQPPSYRETVLKVVQNNFDKLRECFKEASARKDSSIPTKLSTLFRIGKFGNVQSVEFEEASEMSPELNRCIVTRISYFQFPQREDLQVPSKSVRLVLNFGPVQPAKASEEPLQSDE